MKKLFLVGAISTMLVACGEDYIAEVNGRGVEKADFDAYIAHKRITVRNDEQQENILDQYLQREALADYIETKEFSGDALVAAEINELKKEILISRYFERHLKNSVGDDAVLNFYNSNIEKYEEKKVHVAHVLLRLNRNMDESQRKVKLTTAQEAYSKIQNGMDFSEASDKYSEDGVSAKKGGDLGWLAEGSIHKNFSDLAFSLKEGDISQPIETPFGFHIIKVIEAPKVNRKTFESVKGEIRYQLRNQAKQAERQRLLNAITIKKG